MLIRQINRRELAWLAIVIAALAAVLLYVCLRQDPVDELRDAVPDMSCPVAYLTPWCSSWQDLQTATNSSNCSWKMCL